jgi:hypothetical protein
MTTSLQSKLVLLENDLKKMSDVQTQIRAENLMLSTKKNVAKKEEKKIKLAKSMMIAKFQSL